MGLRNAEKMLQLGETYPAKEAVRLGAVDETCPQGKSLEIAQQRMETWLSVPGL
jgi:enoyl-CoA hydratase/carnithine racemase